MIATYSATDIKESIKENSAEVLLKASTDLVYKLENDLLKQDNLVSELEKMIINNLEDGFPADLIFVF
jgi:hypothetical protein